MTVEFTKRPLARPAYMDGNSNEDVYQVHGVYGTQEFRVPAGTPVIWSDPLRLRVVELWREGCSAAQIARDFVAAGHVVTRYSIIGQLHRCGESEQTRDGRAKRSPRAIEHARRGPVRSLKFAGRDYGAAARESVARCDGVAFMELEPHHCRYPVSGDRLSIAFCGATRELGSYCSEHYYKSTGGWK